jgi:hypothetical protein
MDGRDMELWLFLERVEATKTSFISIKPQLFQSFFFPLDFILEWLV